MFVTGEVLLFGPDGNALVVNEQGAARTTLVDAHDKEASFAAFGMLKTAQESTIADYRFDDTLVPANFIINTTGIASYETPDNITGLRMRSGAQASSSIQIQSKIDHFYQAGRGQLFKTSMILGDTGVSGNVREWGLFNDDDGVFFRMDTELKLVIRYNGTDTEIPASTWDVPITADQYGHLYYIQYEWLGVGNIYVYYDEKIVHTYNFLGTSTQFSLREPDLPVRYRNENTTNTSDVTMQIGCCSVSTEGGTVIVGQDENKVLRPVVISTTGRLLVSQEPPGTPDEATGVIRTVYSAVGTTSDDVYVIPNGEVLRIQRFTAGAETDTTAGNVVELFYDPNGTGVGMTVIAVLFVSGTSDQVDLNDYFTGNGTRAIRMRRRRLSGGSKEMFAKWEGYY